MMAIENNHSPKQTNKQTNKPLTYTQGLKRLYPREIEVLDLVERGLINKEIADHLGLSVHTVCAHRRNICSKLAITGRNGLPKWLLKVEK